MASLSRYRRTAVACRLSLSAVGMLVPAAALAESGTDTDALAEIVVTARKIAENVQDIPVSVQVLSADDLAAADRSRLYELQFSIPGLVVNNVGMFGGGFALRGVADQGGSDLSVASHLNGVYLGKATLAIARMFDLERIEVLKGPQGTLYGRNATGGTINVIARAPGDERGASAEVAYGSYDTVRAEGAVDLPFDRVGVRAAFIASGGDGYIRNSVDDRRFAEEDFWGARVSLQAEVTDNLRVDLMAQHVSDDGASGELWTPQPPFLVRRGDIRLTTVTLANPFLETENDLVSLNAAYDVGFATLESTTGYARSEVRGLDDCAGEPRLQGCVRGVRPADYEQRSQELRLAGHGAALDWLIGAYYFDAEDFTNFHFSAPLSNPLPINDSSSWSDETAYAVFGQSTWQTGERWSTTVGLRRSNEDRRVSDVGTGTADHPTLTSAQTDGNRTSWRLDLAYKASERALLYAGVATGFKSGGVTTEVLPDGDFNRFDAEDLVAYEAGFKSQWLAQRATLNCAAFFYDFRDLQITSRYLFADRFITEVENAAKAEIYGIDASGRFQVTDRLAISGAAVWLPKRDFVEFTSQRTGVSLSGNRLSRAPSLSATAAFAYDYPLRNLGAVAARVEYDYRSAFFFTADNGPLFSQGSVGLLNVSLRFEPVAEDWYVFATGRNLTDQDYFNQVFIQSSPGYPATYELGVGYEF